MKTASIQEVKKELIELNKAQLLELCLRLAKYKKDNKELLGFLLFNAHDIDEYIKNVNEEILEMFKEVNSSHVFFAKKTLRKILRFANKHIKYASNKQAEVEILLYYCKQFKKQGSYVFKSTALANLYAAQLKKIAKAIDNLHEDLQFEYVHTLDTLK
jgi:Zn-dependent oligopeptidase